MVDSRPRPRVTVVTPSLNQGGFIRQTIESVLAQDYADVEYIIMDGGSTDGTAAIASEYSSRLRFVSQPDNGQSDGINRGFSLATGEIVAWLNSDDVYLPGAVTSAVRTLQADPSAAFVYGDGYLMDSRGGITRRFPHTQPFDLWRLVYLSDYILQQTCFFRRWALDATGPLTENLRYGMDWDILIRLATRFPVAYVPRYLACLREYPEAKTFSGGVRRAWELHRLLAGHTGQWFPPGAQVYGLDTYSQLARDWADGLGSPWLRQRAARVRQWCERRIHDLVMHEQGLYSDGWAGASLRLMLHANQGTAVMSGSIPSFAPGLARQELSIYVNGNYMGTHRVEGNFRLRIPHRDDDKALSVRIEALRYVQSPTDSRKLAFLFGAFAWEATARSPVSLAPGLSPSIADGRA